MTISKGPIIWTRCGDCRERIIAILGGNILKDKTGAFITRCTVCQDKVGKP